MERYSQSVIRVSMLAGVFFLTALVGLQIYSSFIRRNELTQHMRDIEHKFREAQVDQLRLRGELEYYSLPANFEKELRARFNYRKEGEKLIIVVPRNASSAATSSQ